MDRSESVIVPHTLSQQKKALPFTAETMEAGFDDNFETQNIFFLYDSKKRESKPISNSNSNETSNTEYYEINENTPHFAYIEERYISPLEPYWQIRLILVLNLTLQM